MSVGLLSVIPQCVVLCCVRSPVGDVVLVLVRYSSSCVVLRCVRYSNGVVMVSIMVVYTFFPDVLSGSVRITALSTRLPPIEALISVVAKARLFARVCMSCVNHTSKWRCLRERVEVVRGRFASEVMLFCLLFLSCFLRLLGRYSANSDAVRFGLRSAAVLITASFVPLANLSSSLPLTSSFSVFRASNGSKCFL